MFAHVAHKISDGFWHVKKTIKIRRGIQQKLSKKKSKILKISKFFKIFKKTFIYSQKKYNFFNFQAYSVFSNISETLQILTSKFGFTVPLKPQRNWKNSKIVHFSHMTLFFEVVFWAFFNFRLVYTGQYYVQASQNWFGKRYGIN